MLRLVEGKQDWARGGKGRCEGATVIMAVLLVFLGRDVVPHFVPSLLFVADPAQQMQEQLLGPCPRFAPQGSLLPRGEGRAGCLGHGPHGF